jgi:dipeptidyl aminopeptidase/acylaminoacyl peptidase
VLHLLPLDGGEAMPLPTGDLEPHDAAFSPDGKSIAFLANAPLAGAEKKAHWERGGAEHWGHEFDETKLWVVPGAGGEPRQVDAGPNVVAFAWSPDGTRFAAGTSPSGDPYVASSLTRVAIVDAVGKAPARVMDRPEGSFGAPPRARIRSPSSPSCSRAPRRSSSASPSRVRRRSCRSTA